MKQGGIATIVAALMFFSIDVEARSRAQVNQFRAKHACPANGHHRGPCPGYQIDHLIPLKCNGQDAPSNMQWLTIEAHKAKTKAEALMCRQKK